MELILCPKKKPSHKMIKSTFKISEEKMARIMRIKAKIILSKRLLLIHTFCLLQFFFLYIFLDIFLMQVVVFFFTCNMILILATVSFFTSEF